MFKFMCVLSFSLLLISSIVHCQDDDDDDDDDDHGQGLDEDSSNNFINGFDDSLNSGSGNIDELSGGMFDSDSESDPIDFMDSKRRQSFVRRNFPFFFRRSKNDDDAIIQNNPGSYVSQDGQEHINHGGNFHSSGDDIHSTGGGDSGDGGCSGGCDDDHHHHHHDHHDNDHHRHSKRGGHGHGHDHDHGHGDHHRRGNHHDDHHRYDHNDFNDHHDHPDHHDDHHEHHGHDGHHGPHDTHDPHEHLDLAHEQERKYNERLHEKYASGGPLRPKGLAERMQRSTFGDERLREQPLDPFDPEKRSRYSGYEHKHSLEKGFTPLHPRAALSNFDVDPSFMNHFESSLASDPHNSFPRGSFYGLDGFYGNSRLIRDKLLSPYSLKTASKKMPCDSGCDFDDDKKKKKR